MKKNLGTLFLAIAGSFTAVAAQAQADFPNKPVRIIVPFAPGGSADNSARILADQLTKRWKQSVIIENKPGANGALGAAQVAKSAADGYTIYYAPVSIGTINLFIKKPGFDVKKDLVPVTQVARGDYVLNVQKDLPVNTIGEFASYARANPTKVFHGYFGGASLLAFEQLAEKQNFPVTNVAYRGEALALTALIGGEIQAMFSTLSSARPFIEAGKIKALGVLSKTRSAIAPEIKSAEESGIKGFDVNFWFGLMVPTGTPASTINTINAAVNEELSNEEVKGRFYTMGLTAAATTPAEFGKIVQYESERWVETAKRIGLEPQ